MSNETPGAGEKPASPSEARIAESQAHRNKHFPKKRTRPPSPTQIQGAEEDRHLLLAQRAFYVDMLERFPTYLARLDAKVTAAEAERSSLIQKHDAAAGKIVECDRMLAALEKTYHLTPLKTPTPRPAAV